MSRSHDIYWHSLLDAFSYWEFWERLRLHVGYARLKNTILQLLPWINGPLWCYLLAILFKAISLIQKSWRHKIWKNFLKPYDMQFDLAFCIYNGKHNKLESLYPDKNLFMDSNLRLIFSDCTDRHSRAICYIWELSVFCNLLGCNWLFLDAHYSYSLLQKLYFITSLLNIIKGKQN